MRFQPIVSCRGTYQDAVSVPCLGAPFIRCIWTVGIKKCAVTVPTLRPLGLLEMRKSRLCVRPSLGTSPCATRCSRPRAPHTFGNRGRGAPGASHPARAPPQAAPSSSASSWCLQRFLLSRIRHSLALLRAAFQLHGFALPALPFPMWKATFLVNGVGFTAPCSRGALLQSTCSVSLWKAAQRGSVGSTPGAGDGTAQLPLQLQSSGKAEGSKHALLWWEKDNFVCRRNLKLNLNLRPN